MAEDDDSVTKSTKTRWVGTGTFAAVVLLLTLSAVVLIYAYRGAKLPLWASATFGLVTLTAAAWAFGESALKAASEAKGGE